MISKETRLKIFKKASLCRKFEEKVFEKLKNKTITFPAYLSAGQEYISATIATYMEINNIDPQIFIQHRGHSTYLNFGGNPKELIDELLGRPTGCANGMGGSASIHCKEKNIYGHDGLMGSQVPIAVGACYASKKPTIVFMGDAAAEEDYVLGALGWASTKNLPILFVVEDNNLSILTEKSVRRNWSMVSVAKSFNLDAYEIPDTPYEIYSTLDYIGDSGVFSKPALINVNTHRKFWHSGAGIDDPNIYDRHKVEFKKIDNADLIDKENEKLVDELWKIQLKL